MELKEKVFESEKFNEIKESINSFVSTSENSFNSDNGFTYSLAMKAYQNMQQQAPQGDNNGNGNNSGDDEVIVE